MTACEDEKWKREHWRAIETAYAQTAVIVRRADESTGFVSVRAESAMDARAKLNIVMIVAHGVFVVARIILL